MYFINLFEIFHLLKNYLDLCQGDFPANGKEILKNFFFQIIFSGVLRIRFERVNKKQKNIG